MKQLSESPSREAQQLINHIFNAKNRLLERENITPVWTIKPGTQTGARLQVRHMAVSETRQDFILPNNFKTP